MKRWSRPLALAVAAGTVMVCLFMLFTGISLQKATHRQDQTYTGTTEATVADYEVRQEEIEITDANDFTTTRIVDFYCPVFVYTVDGREYRTVSDSGSGSREYPEGSAVTLCYLPEDPSQVFVAGDTSRSFVPYILYAMSLVCGAISVKAFLDVRKSED